jgi:hypothetical protein
LNPKRKRLRGEVLDETRSNGESRAGSKQGRRKQIAAWEANWQWRDRDGTWISYKEEDSARIDAAMDRRESVTIMVDAVEYTVDPQKLIQRRSGVEEGAAKSARPEYAVRRWDPEWSEDRELRWNKSIRVLYPSWESQTSPLLVCPVSEGTRDYDTVAGKLFGSEGCVTTRTHEICRVVRVQNLDVFIKYSNERDSITRRRGAG